MEPLFCVPILSPEQLDRISFSRHYAKLIRQLRKTYDLPGGVMERFSAYQERRATVQEVVGQYSSPQRAYHTLEHILSGLVDLAAVRHQAEYPHSLEFAWIYHDVIYDPQQKDNEEQSAQFVQQHCQRLCLPREFSIRTSDLVLATAHFTEQAYSAPDAQLIVDIDLAILGKPWPVFERYNRQIAQEYRWVVEQYGEEFYHARRKNILQSFLPPQRERIYQTDYFYQKYEAQARVNLERVLSLDNA